MASCSEIKAHRLVAPSGVLLCAGELGAQQAADRVRQPSGGGDALQRRAVDTPGVVQLLIGAGEDAHGADALPPENGCLPGGVLHAPLTAVRIPAQRQRAYRPAASVAVSAASSGCATGNVSNARCHAWTCR